MYYIYRLVLNQVIYFIIIISLNGLLLKYQFINIKIKEILREKGNKYNKFFLFKF